jgi:hypothetical protein
MPPALSRQDYHAGKLRSGYFLEIEMKVRKDHLRNNGSKNAPTSERGAVQGNFRRYLRTESTKDAGLLLGSDLHTTTRMYTPLLQGVLATPYGSPGKSVSTRSERMLDPSPSPTDGRSIVLIANARVECAVPWAAAA